MSLSHEGFPLVIGATVLAIITYALALRLRSWPLWLTAFAFTLLVLGIAWAFRAPHGATASLPSQSLRVAESAGHSLYDGAPT